MITASLAAHAETSFNYDLQGDLDGQVDGSGGGFYAMAGRFHLTLIHAPGTGDTLVLDFAAKSSDPLAPGRYSIGMFGQISAGLEIRAADRLTEYDATGGTLVIHTVGDASMQGEFELQLTDMDNGSTIGVNGGFAAEPVDTSNE